jgi:hypothetical protein
MPHQKGDCMQVNATGFQVGLFPGASTLRAGAARRTLPAPAPPPVIGAGGTTSSPRTRAAANTTTPSRPYPAPARSRHRVSRNARSMPPPQQTARRFLGWGSRLKTTAGVASLAGLVDYENGGTRAASCGWPCARMSWPSDASTGTGSRAGPPARAELRPVRIRAAQRHDIPIQSRSSPSQPRNSQARKELA